MKHLTTFIACLLTIFANAEDTTFSSDRLQGFYDAYLCEEKQNLFSVGLSTTTCGSIADPFHPPSNPPPPPFKSGLLPIVIVNNSTVADDQVYVVVTGKDQTTAIQAFVSIDPSTGVGTLAVANPGDNATNYGLQLSQLPVASTGRVIYLPYIIGGEIWFSMNSKLNMPVDAPHSIVQPNFLSPADPNYYTNFDIFEVAYTSNSTPNIAADATAVSFHSIPLYGYISTPSSTNNTTGLYQPRSFIMAHAASILSSAFSPEVNQWNNLFLKNGSTILRLLSTGKAMSNTPTPIFDQNYLDNLAAYGYSYIADIWTSLTSFYRTHPLTLTIPNGSLETYTGVIDVSNTITLTSSPSGYVVVFSAPTTSAPTTSFNIFSGKTLVQSDTSPGAADGVQLFKLFEEAIIAGLVPTANTLSNPYLAANQSSFYTPNPNLSAPGPTTGPWYDLYSKALHSLGFIYTFAFDEPLWPQVQIFSNTLQPNSTYLGITIGSVQ